MEVTLSNDFEQYIAELIGTGKYESSSEVIESGLRLLMKQTETPEKIARLRALLLPAIEELRAGKGIPFTDELFEDIIREGKRRLAEDRQVAEGS